MLCNFPRDAQALIATFLIKTCMLEVDGRMLNLGLVYTHANFSLLFNVPTIYVVQASAWKGRCRPAPPDTAAPAHSSINGSAEDERSRSSMMY